MHDNLLTLYKYDTRQLVFVNKYYYFISIGRRKSFFLFCLNVRELIKIVNKNKKSKRWKL